MNPLMGGGLTNSGTMPISGGDAGPSNATNANHAGQGVGSIYMSPVGVSPWLIAVVMVIFAYLMWRK